MELDDGAVFHRNIECGLVAEFIQAEGMSESYQELASVTQMLVALRAEDGNARTVGEIYLQLIRGRIAPRMNAERILNGPTSDVWIGPWAEHLETLGVTFHRKTPVTAIDCDRRRVTGVTVLDNGTETEVQADYYAAALPVEAMPKLLPNDLRRGAPSLAQLDRIGTGWMSGIQFFLDPDSPLAHGHQLYFDAPWALTSISQQQFWNEYELPTSSDGEIEGVCR